MDNMNTPPFRLPHQPLVSNGYALSSAPNRLGALISSPATLSIQTVRQLFHSQGYVWFKGFFERDEVLAFRRRFFDAFQQTGLVRPGSDPQEGIFSGHDDTRLTQRILMEFVRTAAYEAFCLHPKLWQFYDAFFESPSYLHKRKIVRYMPPGNTSTTPAHYDLIYLRGGTDKVVSSWIPLGDTTIEMGGLVYLKGSHSLGRKMEADFSVQNANLSPAERISAYNKNMTEGGWVGKDLGGMAERFDARWLIADYEAGDMVIHSPYMIHAATNNVDEMGRIRLSTDIRYQSIREEVDVRWNNHWSVDDML
jgi:ectoine hydroxylase-related dioxygenase (phytanoyl-CoA dioxygenase family)